MSKGKRLPPHFNFRRALRWRRIAAKYSFFFSRLLRNWPFAILSSLARGTKKMLSCVKEAALDRDIEKVPQEITIFR
jgi:hypothetical protein